MLLVHLSEMSKKLSKRRWQLWFALRARACGAWLSHPTLFEVFWVPFLLFLYHRGRCKNPELCANVRKLWEYWCEDHLPWRLKRRLERLQENWRKLLHENFDLRRQARALSEQKGRTE